MHWMTAAMQELAQERQQMMDELKEEFRVPFGRRMATRDEQKALFALLQASGVVDRHRQLAGPEHDEETCPFCQMVAREAGERRVRRNG